MEDYQTRKKIQPGYPVKIAVKVNGQYEEELREGIVKDILTNSATHPRGIKVRLYGGTVGRVQEIIYDD